MINRKERRPFSVPELVRHILLAWLGAVTLEYYMLPASLRDLAGLDGLVQMSFGWVIGLTVLGTAVLFILGRFFDLTKFERWAMAGIFGILAAGVLAVSFTWAFFVACALILEVLIGYAMSGWDRDPVPAVKKRKEKKLFLWISAGLAGLFFLFVSVWTVARIYSFSTPTYDFGIFSQMFYSMKETGLPITTVERDGALSHFAVHVSPIYYLMLPFYMLFPAPATLQVLQAAVLASAVIPLWLLGRNHGLTPLQRTLLAAVLLVYPAFSGGTSYDIHENCFLTPLILWMLYGMDRESSIITAVAAALTLGVKEDAAVYVAVAALYLILRTALNYRKESRKSLITGIVMLGSSLVWFFLVTGYLAESGDGVMTYRYENFMFDGSSSLLTVIKAVLMSPMKAVYECVDPEKLKFIAMTLLPLLGLPLVTRRYERYILLIPYVLLNLMSDYQYQHDIFFQYTFGSTAFLIYLAVVNLQDLRPHKIRLIALSGALVIGIACFCQVVIPKAMYYPKTAVQYNEYYDRVREGLSVVPDGASVSATTFYTTELSQREILYDVRYCSKAHILETEYVVLNVSASGDFKRFATGGKNNGFDNLVDFLERNGYTLYHEVDRIMVIYHKDLN